MQNVVLFKVLIKIYVNKDIAINKRMKYCGLRSNAICKPTYQVSRTFEITGLSKLPTTGFRVICSAPG